MAEQTTPRPRYSPENDTLARLILYSLLAFPLLALFGEGLGVLLRLQGNFLYMACLIGGWCAWLVGLSWALELKKKRKQRQGLYTPPLRGLRSPHPLSHSEWRILWGMFAVCMLTAACTDGYLFALAGSAAFALFMLTAFLRGRGVDRLRCYLRLEWILLAYSLPILAITALIPLQVQWYPQADNAVPHAGLHLFFPALGTLFATSLLEACCMRRITRPPDARDQRHLGLARLNKWQWLAWIAWRVACVAGVLTGSTLLGGPLLSSAYFPTIPSLVPTLVTAEGSACCICLAVIPICAVLDLLRRNASS